MRATSTAPAIQQRPKGGVMPPAPPPAPDEPRCDTCGFVVDVHEGGRCAWCRMVARGDNVLVAHDDRGWHHPTHPDRRIRCACGGEGCNPVNPALLAEPGEPHEGGISMAEHDDLDDADAFAETVIDRGDAIGILAQHMTYPELVDAIVGHFEIDRDEIYAARDALSEVTS